MKKYFTNNSNRVQLVLVVLVWLLLFAMPVLFTESTEQINWNLILKVWKDFGLLLCIFLINRFILMPYLFLREKRIAYFISILGVIAICSWFVFLLSQHKQGLPPMDLPLPPPPHGGPHGDFMPPMRPRLPQGIPPYANLIIMSVLLIGFDSGLIFFSKWMSSEQHKLKAEREGIANKMAFLKSQISPHFFMNTLNNIHALVDINTEEAKDAIIKLSHMMNYMLYESEQEGVTLKQEMDFTESYVELMKLRITKDVDLQLEIPEILPQVKLPPLLTISFIENAFKYGISYQNPSFIHIKISTTDHRFVFQVSNRIHQEIKQNKNSGIGIDNAQKRLDLLYGDNYDLQITKQDDIFSVYLSFPI